MATVVITGHTWGIGQAVADYFTRAGWTVRGCSRSTGFDIADPEARQRIVDLCADAEIFVNNAYVNNDDSQLLLAQAVYDLWQGDLTRLMIVMGTRLAEMTVEPSSPRWPYFEHKSRLDQWCRGRNRAPTVCQIRMGFVATPRTNWVAPGTDMSTVEEVAQVVEWIVSNRKTFCISQVSMGPAVID